MKIETCNVNLDRMLNEKERNIEAFRLTIEYIIKHTEKINFIAEADIYEQNTRDKCSVCNYSATIAGTTYCTNNEYVKRYFKIN